MINLKACSLCGNKANSPKWFVGSPEGFGIECSNMNCHEGIYGYETEKEAIEAWQFRPLEDALTARVAELEGALSIAKNDLNLSSSQITFDDEVVLQLKAKIARLVEAGDRMAESSSYYDEGDKCCTCCSKFDGEHFDDCPVTLWEAAKED